MPDITQMPISQTLSDGQYLFGITGTDGVRVPASALNTWKPTTDAITSNVTALNTNLNELKFGEISGGANVWNEKTRIGAVESNGSFNTASTNRLSTDFIEVKPSTTYTQVAPSNARNGRCCEYDENKQLVNFNGSGVNTSITTQATTKYLVITFGYNYGVVYNNDIALVEGTQSIPYEPYIPSIEMLNNDVESLNHINNDLEFLGWSVPSELGVQNYKDSEGNFHQLDSRIDMSTLSWARYKFGDVYLFYTNISDRKSKGVCYQTKYTESTPSAVELLGNKEISYINNTTYIYVRDDSYSDADSFKASLQNVYLYYELGTPITHNVGAEVVSEINNSLCPTAFNNSGLTYTDCTYSSGGIVRIGKFVYVNISVTATVTSGRIAINGFPSAVEFSALACVNLSSPNSAIKQNIAFMNKSGQLNVVVDSTYNNLYCISGVYLAS